MRIDENSFLEMPDDESFDGMERCKDRTWSNPLKGVLVAMLNLRVGRCAVHRGLAVKMAVECSARQRNDEGGDGDA